MSDNPYLAHQQQGTSSSSSGSPLDGWIPRKIGGAQVVKAMVSKQSLNLANSQSSRAKANDQPI